MIYFFKFPLKASFGGAEIHTLGLAKHLQNQGQDIKLFTSDAHLFRLFEKHGLRRKRLFAGWEPTAKWSLLLWPLTYFIARARLKKIVNDAPTGSTFYCQSLTEKLILLPLLQPTTYNLQAIFIEHKIPGRWLKLNPLKFNYLRLAKTVKIITVSKFAKQEFIKLGVPENNIEVVPPTSHSVIARPSRPKQSRFTIGILSRLDPEKGVLDFLHSVIPGLTRNPSWRILIGGSGPLESKIKELIFNHKLQDQIQLLGFVYDLDEFFSRISALAYPSKVPESFGMAAAEAVARGIPVVARNIGALPEIIKHGENGFLIDDNEKWIECLEKVRQSWFRFSF